MITGNPDLEYFGGMTFQAGVLFKQARERGYQGMFMSDDGFDSSDATKIAGQALLNGGGTCYSTVSGTAEVYPGTANFFRISRQNTRLIHNRWPSRGMISWPSVSRRWRMRPRPRKTKCPPGARWRKPFGTLKDFQGITGTVSFNAIGDPTVVQYFVIKVKSADPAKWSENTAVETLNLAPPQ